MDETAPLHATLIAAFRLGRWRGVLLLGASGAGKSDLALRAIQAGWRLVADDRVRVWRSGGAAYGCAPATISGLIEVRGLGVTSEAHLAFARLVLAVEACQAARVERMPEPQRLSVAQAGAELPLLRLDLREASALSKVERCLRAAARGRL